MKTLIKLALFALFTTVTMQSEAMSTDQINWNQGIPVHSWANPIKEFDQYLPNGVIPNGELPVDEDDEISK